MNKKYKRFEFLTWPWPNLVCLNRNFWNYIIELILDLSTKSTSTTKKLLDKVEYTLNIGNFFDTCAANLPFGRQSDDFLVFSSKVHFWFPITNYSLLIIHQKLGLLNQRLHKQMKGMVAFFVFHVYGWSILRIPTEIMEIKYFTRLS